MIENVLCPACEGICESPGIVCGNLGCRHVMLKCSLCGGLGNVTPVQHARYLRGQELRKRRVEQNKTLRQEADRLGITQSELSKMEQGLIDPPKEDKENGD